MSDVERLRELGLYDPDAPDAEERLRLLELVLAMGATEEEVLHWAAAGQLGPLALDLAMRTADSSISFADAATRAGLSVDDAAALWRALGFPDPRQAEQRVPSDTVEALRVLAAIGNELFGEEASLGIARVMGGTATRLAQSLVDAFRAEVEIPLLSSGTPYVEVAERFTRAVRDDLPAVFDAFAAITRQHLVAQASGTWSMVGGESIARRDLIIGFADLVGYTTLSRTLSGSALASLIRNFERLLGETVAVGGGRVVKLIGDGAMFACDGADVACDIALGLGEAFSAAAPDVPPVRVGLAAGSVVALQGDYYGPPVNVAARLVAIAQPSTVAVDEEVRRRAGESFAFERLPPRPLKGLPNAPAYLLASRHSA